MNFLLEFIDSAYPLTLYCAFFISLADNYTTSVVVSRHGVEQEMNPLYRFAMRRWGAVGLWTAWFFYWILLLTFFRDSPRFAFFVFCFFTIAVVINLIIMAFGKNLARDGDELSKSGL